MAFFMIVYNFLPAQTVSKGVLIGAIVICAILGGAVSYAFFMCFKSWAVALLGAYGGIILIIFLIKLIGVQNSGINLIGAVVGAIAGGYLGKTYNKFVKTTFTSIIGAYFLIRGAGTIFGGFPSDFNSE